MKDETKVFQWLKEQNAPFGIQLQILQAFQLYKVIVEMDKKLMLYEERAEGENVISSLQYYFQLFYTRYEFKFLVSKLSYSTL